MRSHYLFRFQLHNFARIQVFVRYLFLSVSNRTVWSVVLSETCSRFGHRIRGSIGNGGSTVVKVSFSLPTT
ncbi:unnamed protein product [Ilex paraguariensis]